MSYRDYVAEGYGPEDLDEPDLPEPTEIHVTVFMPVAITNEWGEPDTIDAPCCKSWPLAFRAAAYRWAAYWERKRGKANVDIEVD